MNLKVEKNEKSKKLNVHYDYTLIVLVGLLVCFGLVMVASSSAYTAVKYDYGATFFLERQGLMAAVGAVIMLFVSKFDYNNYIKAYSIRWSWIIEAAVFLGGSYLLFNKLGENLTQYAVWQMVILIVMGGISVLYTKLETNPKVIHVKFIVLLFYVCVLLQGLVMVIGASTNGSTRWLNLPIIGRFQPSELSKLCIVIFVAFIVNAKPTSLNSFRGFLKRLIGVIVLVALVVGENLSTALIMIGIAFIVCFVASRKWAYYFVSLIILVVAAIVGIFTVGYRADRITQWLDVENEGYQILQGLYAICSGGWFGKGLGNSVQKLGYIPEVHTDMIFSIICEELGILGVIILLTVYIMLLWRIFKIAINAPNLFGSLVCVGSFAHIALQLILNIAVVTNTLPSTGVTLPFISYGGTSLIVLLIEMGVVINVSSQIEYDE